MVCPKCGSENVNVQMVTETKMKNKHHGFIWWICIGVWWVPVKWLLFTFPALIFALFGSKKKEAKTVHKTMCVCQNCGHSWKA
jgi:Zn finger protein HypA/HybF involved in hydrogenase expression